MKGRGIGMVKLRERISVKDVGLLLIGAVIYSIGTHAFMVPANIAPGGASGIALMVNYLTDLPVGALTLVLSIMGTGCFAACTGEYWSVWAWP